MIERIRKKCLKEFKTYPELYHEIDIERVKSDNWQIERFVIEHETEDKAYESLIETLKWKKTYGVHERDDQYFPKEFYELHETEMFGRDKAGRPIHWEVMKNTVKIQEFTQLEQQFIVHRIEKLDTEGSRDGWTLVSDTLGSGLANVNLEMFKFKVDLLKYYPQGMKSVLNIDLPWILNSIIKIILMLLSPNLRECVKFITRDQLPDYVDKDLIPVSLNGNREKKLYPEGIKLMGDLSHLNLNEKQIESYYKKHQMISKRHN